jgi:hypothetical protein
MCIGSHVPSRKRRITGTSEWHLGHAIPQMLSNEKVLSESAGVLEKLRKVTVSFIMTVRPSVRPHGKRLLLDGF